MTQLAPNAFLQKWNSRFADNDTFQVDEADFREFTADLVVSFQSTIALNVPPYVPGTFYPAGFLILQPFGASSVFLKANISGQLPAPTGPSADANWVPTLSPVVGQALSQVGTVDALRQEQGSWVPGRLYVINGRVAGLGVAQPDVCVRAVSPIQLEPEGWSIDMTSLAAIPERVAYDLMTDTTTPVVAASSFADLLGLPADNAALAAALAGRDTTEYTIYSTGNSRVYALNLERPLRLLSAIAKAAGNASGVTCQVNTYDAATGTWANGQPQASLSDANIALAALSPAQLAAGAELEIQTTPRAISLDSFISLSFIYA
jgi:hypothetical protein